jgi:hypothetical protein
MTAAAGENGSNEESRNADALLEKLRKRTGGPKGSGLTPALIDELLIKGHSVTEIGKMFNTSRQNVSQMRRRRTGFYQSPRERVLEQNFPWKVPHAFGQMGLRRAMRDHGDFMATGGKGMAEGALARVRALYRKLTELDAVVEFSPDIPPNEHSSAGGFRLVSREDSDGDLMIRVNRHTTLTEEGKMIWRVPRRDLWP